MKQLYLKDIQNKYKMNNSKNVKSNVFCTYLFNE